jgi:hypothetical protein
MSSYTLHTDAGNFRALKIIIAAEYNGVAIDTPEFALGKVNHISTQLIISLHH